jgi:hypothetical protein
MIYQIKITLDRIRPPIWRRVQVPGDITLAALHDVVQLAMGWFDGHLHEFEMAGCRYGPQMDDDFGADLTTDEMNVKLSDIIDREKARLKYTYDFGDDWQHTLTVEKIMPAGTGNQYPICLTGKRACPPEDCGGPWGYGALLEAQKHPDDPRNRELLEWAEGFDPEAFDLDSINAGLRRLG